MSTFQSSGYSQELLHVSSPCFAWSVKEAGLERLCVYVVAER